MPSGILPARYLRDSRVIDNRPPEDTEEFLRARVEAMDRRIKELEAENARLRAEREKRDVPACDCESCRALAEGIYNAFASGKEQ